MKYRPISDEPLQAIAAELKNREDQIIDLRVRLKGTLRFFGESCFTCFYLQDPPHEYCDGCHGHCKYVYMFE